MKIPIAIPNKISIKIPITLKKNVIKNHAKRGSTESLKLEKKKKKQKKTIDWKKLGDVGINRGEQEKQKETGRKREETGYWATRCQKCVT